MLLLARLSRHQIPVCFCSHNSKIFSPTIISLSSLCTFCPIYHAICLFLFLFLPFLCWYFLFNLPGYMFFSPFFSHHFCHHNLRYTFHVTFVNRSISPWLQLSPLQQPLSSSYISPIILLPRRTKQ